MRKGKGINAEIHRWEYNGLTCLAFASALWDVCCPTCFEKDLLALALIHTFTSNSSMNDSYGSFLFIWTNHAWGMYMTLINGSTGKLSLFQGMICIEYPILACSIMTVFVRRRVPTLRMLVGNLHGHAYPIAIILWLKKTALNFLAFLGLMTTVVMKTGVLHNEDVHAHANT